MKRIFTFAMLAMLVVAGSVSAQTTLRKTWDFREGFSTKTVNALAADQEEFGPDKNWRNYESDATKADQQHFWCASSSFKNADGYACTHSGDRATVIPELEGLKLGATAAKKFVITYNGGQSDDQMGDAPGGKVPYGNSYVWLNGKNETITFYAEVNQTIKIAVESHAVNASKLGEARGISLTAGSGTLTPKFEGNPVPTYYTEYEWELTGDPGAISELVIKSTNGCHIYYIIVGDGDDPNANKSKVAYLTAGDGTTETAYQTLAADQSTVLTAIDLSSATLTADQLQQYDAVVVSNLLPADNAAVSVLKEALPFTPVLNLNADLYGAWGYGEKTAGTVGMVLLTNLKSELFDGFALNEDYTNTSVDGETQVDVIDLGASFTGVLLGDYFADDVVLGADPYNALTGLNVVGIHAHNLYHNAYVYLPAEAADKAKLMSNALAAVLASKSPIEKTSAPKITLDYKHQNTNIVLAMASSNLPKPHIYYTLDGSTPTEQSAEYTEPINVTSETTVKAVAIAEGYLLSDVAEATAKIYEQPATPTIAPVYEDGKTTVTLASATEGVDIWYNYTAVTDTTKSMKYTEPLVFTLPTDLHVFAVAAGTVFSELGSQRILVKNVVVRQDKIGVFDANATEWQQGGSNSTVYYFTWGKNASSIYDTTQPGTTTTDPDTGDEVTVYPEVDYQYYVPQVDGQEAQWEVKSKGQVMIWQSLSIGKDPGNDGGYNPETAGDIKTYADITANDIQFGGKTSGETCTGAIQSRVKFQAPFDVLTYVGTAAGGDNVGRMQVQVSTDSLEWVNVGEEMNTSVTKRLWKSYTRSYEGTDEVYVRVIQAGGGASVQIYNIYVLNEGENSKTLKDQYNDEFTGVADLQAPAVKAPAAIYSLNGTRQQQLRRGLNIVVGADGTVKKVLVK